ncbi:MAG: GNAT family N-acetyltransferase [Bacteroidetes bacterium]|nr:GNAT family N-acetyltransferase [Bacteroidota bacterium]
MHIFEIKAIDELSKVTDVMAALRPQLNTGNIETIIGGMMQRGYRLLYLVDGNEVKAALGFRFTEHLMWGKSIYVDDLSTLPGERKKGYARKLLDEVMTIAKEAHCNELHLDSGCGAQRYDAHRLYLKYGFNITSHHFAMKVV